jgi:hypothetical protein
MSKVLSILLLLLASGAEASVQSFKADDTATLRPVSIMEKHPAADIDLKRTCKPVLLFMRFPDGRVMLVGIVQSKAAC